MRPSHRLSGTPGGEDIASGNTAATVCFPARCIGPCISSPGVQSFNVKKERPGKQRLLVILRRERTAMDGGSVAIARGTEPQAA